MKHVLLLLAGMSLFFSSLIFAGPNENAGITFDLNATTTGNQNLIQIPQPNAGDYIRVDIYAQDVVNLDTYEFEILYYNHTRLQYITASPLNPITFEPNILTINGGTALGWMIDTSTPGVLSIAYTLAGTDTLEAPEGEGLIAHVVFQALTTGNSYLNFGNVYYHDSYGTMDVITNKGMAFLGGVPPMPPTELTAFSDTVFQNSIRLTWVDPTENVDGTPLEDLAGINVYYSDCTFITFVEPGVETYAVQGLTIGEYHNFYVTAYDNETPVNESLPSDTTGATTVIAPMPPSGFNVYSDYTTPNSIQLTWTDPTENIDGSPLTDLNHIDVYYSDGTLIASVNPCVEIYTDNGLTDGQLYSYYLISVANNSNYYNTTDTISWHVGGSPIPSPPNNLVAEDTLNSIILTWIDPTTQVDETPLDDLAGINIYYADSSFIASVDPGAESYTVSGLIPNHCYFFYVTAYDNETPVNESEPSNTTGAYIGTLLYVHPDSTLNSIQTALNLCTHNDTVLVAASTYYENIIWTGHPWNIHLISESGPESTIIDGGGSGRVIWMHTGGPGSEDNHPRLEGFTIQNGNADYGGAIYSVGWGKATIIGNIITNNTAVWDGGGIWCNHSLVIIDNIITNNITIEIGFRSGGIYFNNGSTDIIGNTINQNSGCGIYCDRPSSPNIIGNTITQNGGGINAFWSSPTLIDNVIADNNGWGLNYEENCGGTITNCTVTGNTSGGIYLGISWPTITLCVISNNGGEGIFSGVLSSPTVTYCIISNNDGNGVYSFDAAHIHYCDITDNAGFGVFDPCDCAFTPAQNNWWGDPSGPGGVGPGTGDEVSDYVEYIPWLTEPVSVTVSVPQFACGEPGETITIHVNTTDITGDGVLSAEFTLSYEPIIITGIDVDVSGTLLFDTDWTWDYDVTSGQISVEMTGADTLAGSGILIKLIFVVAPDAVIGDTSSLHFENFVYNEGIPPVTTEDGIFIVGQIFGAIEGTVTDASTGNSIAGAIVTAYNTVTYRDTTDANGYYLMPEVFNYSYDMTVTAFGYNEFDTTGVVVIGGETTDVNFSMLHPEISVNPSSFDVEIPVDTTYSTTMTINNTGNGPLDFTISIGEGSTNLVKSIGISPRRIRSIQRGKPSLPCGIHSIQQGGINPIPQGKPHDPATESIKTDDLVGIFQLAPNSENSNLEPKQGLLRPSPYEETIHYDGENWSGVGLGCGGTFEGAIRLTPDELGPYDEWELISVLFYYFASDTYSGQIKVYGAGSSSEPGALITSEPYYVNESGWYRIDLTEPVTIDATQDLWTSVEIAGYNYPLGVDIGPAIQGKGDFVYSGEWNELYLVGIDRNLNIRAIVAPKLLDVIPDSGTVNADQSLDLIVHFETYGLTANSTYTTNILIHNNSVDSLVTIPVTLHVGLVGVDDDETTNIPKVFALRQNYPNPFSAKGITGKGRNSQTTISYTFPKSCKVSLKIYNIKGQLVETLVDDFQQPGYHSVVWNGKNDNNENVSSGIYFYRISAGDFTDTKKCVILK